VTGNVWKHAAVGAAAGEAAGGVGADGEPPVDASPALKGPLADADPPHAAQAARTRRAVME
jgi:hypothetical protein